jgi:hypothetical protein
MNNEVTTIIKNRNNMDNEQLMKIIAEESRV